MNNFKEKYCERVNKILNIEFKDIIKAILYFLIVVFLIIFISAVIVEKGELNPFFTALSVTLFFCGFIFICFLIYILFDYITERNLQITKLSKVDFMNDEQLYRDILNDYSPVLLSYIDKMRFDYDISMVSGLLSLENKGYIEIFEDKINIIKYDFFNLDMPERYIIENIRNGKVENTSQLKDIVFENGKEKGLLILNENWIGKNPKGFKKLMIFIIIYFFVMYPILEAVIQYFNNIMFLKDVISLIAFLGYIYVMMYVMKSQENSYNRTKIAEELNQKLEGLKNYINEYTLLKEKTSKDITLWEDYLIYSVIFNVNKDIIKEYKKYY